jgi:hypothetical protein
MDNILIIKGRSYRLEKVWRLNKQDHSRDSKGELYPFPTQQNPWPDSKTLANRLALVNEYLELKKKYELYDVPRDCLICGKKNITTKRFIFMETIWEDGLLHYITEHNIQPSIKFKQLLFRNDVIDVENKRTKQLLKNESMLTLERIKKNNKQYVMIERNQLMILDALMIHGGYSKRYVDVEKDLNRYSEHAGLLDFEGTTLTKIVVSGRTNRVDVGDDEIFLPMHMEEMFEYEYIFHTHPPTPKPGGRAVDGILYEFPSIGDLYHFIDHHNEGNVIGSLVVTAEGLYNIRKLTSTINDIDVDEDALYKNYQKASSKIQKDAINKYGTKFNSNYFYSRIAQDTSYIETLNGTLNEYEMHIDYYPRQKNKSGNWFIDTVFLVFRKNK